MRILVTGAAGFIGSHLCEHLTAIGHEVRGLDAFTPYYAPELKRANAATLAEKGVPVSTLDLASDDLGPAIAGCDVIYHLAAQPGLSPKATFDSYMRDNVLATHRLVESALRATTPPIFINIATSSVYGADATGDETSEPRPTSYYGVTKLAAEQLVLAAGRSRGLRACSFRLYSVYGPRERPDKLFPTLIRSILADEPFPLFEGSERHKRSYTFVDDAVAGLSLALENLQACTGQLINIGNDASITTGQAIEIVEAILGRRAHIDRQPHRAGDQDRTHANIAKARRLLGYQPANTPHHGLARTVAWCRHNPELLRLPAAAVRQVAV